ncbi:hypothetical protein [Mesotoga prima]|nr:hypothetical protein [Mesotoga prima]
MVGISAFYAKKGQTIGAGQSLFSLTAISAYLIGMLKQVQHD